MPKDKVEVNKDSGVTFSLHPDQVAVLQNSFMKFCMETYAFGRMTPERLARGKSIMDELVRGIHEGGFCDADKDGHPCEYDVAKLLGPEALEAYYEMLMGKHADGMVGRQLGRHQ